MKRQIEALAGLVLMLGLAAGTPAAAAPGSFVSIVQMTGGLADPIGVTNAGDGSGRLFILERSGRIRIWTGSQLLATPFLDVQTLTQCPADCGERGLLGLAFHPNYETNGVFYIFYTRGGDGTLVIARYQVSANPNVANAASGDVLLTIPHPRGNHNGGQLAFGPDGYLYIATGDGGDGGDPDENGQNTGTLLGKILRIDVSGDDFPADTNRDYRIPAGNPFANEVWNYGLRNPWRFSFDRTTGDLYIGDVGQGTWEEIDFQAAASAGGVNYGWDCREGAHNYSDPNGDRNANCGSVTSVDPILEYDHSLGCSVTGGFVFRNLPGHTMTGNYIYGDFCSGRIWRGVRGAGGTWTGPQVFDTGFGVSSFGESETGRLYFTDLFGDTLQWFAPHSFADVPPTHFAWAFVESVYGAAITGGCGGDNYCPETEITRAQMAVFLLTAKHGPGYVPPPATGTVFNDVPAGSFAAAYIEQLFAEGIATGCGGGNYCPDSPVTREQMAVFLLSAKEGAGYTPPACTPLFADVPCSSSFAPWVDELSRRGITSGCGGGNYCPSLSVTRGQMAVFLATTFGLPRY
ncbi:MAG TPA: PQQ-dependent sugar dehydrogenase [Thermoanaerobaculia bacterium]